MKNSTPTRQVRILWGFFLKDFVGTQVLPPRFSPDTFEKDDGIPIMSTVNALQNVEYGWDRMNLFKVTIYKICCQGALIYNAKWVINVIGTFIVTYFGCVTIMVKLEAI